MRKLMLLLAALATLTTVPAEAAENCSRIEGDLHIMVMHFGFLRNAVTPILFKWRDAASDTKRLAADVLSEVYMLGEHMDSLAGRATDAACPGAETINAQTTSLLLTAIHDGGVALYRSLNFGEPLPDGWADQVDGEMQALMRIYVGWLDKYR